MLKALPFVLVATAVACANPTEPAGGTDSFDIIGGVEANSASLDAVGAMMSKNWDGELSPFCTATLVEPSLVITAKHCVTSEPGERPRAYSEETFFAIGADSAHPKATYRVTEVITAPLDEGGFVEYGNDVALLVLEKPVEGVAPFALNLGEIPSSRVGKQLTAIGFGIRDRDRTLGERRMGNLTLQALSGKPMAKVFGDRAKLDSYLAGIEGEEYPKSDAARIDKLWNLELLRGYEAYLGMGDGDVQPCSGDSGGPLVGKVNGALTVFGVVSGSFKGRTYPCSVVGEVYAMFGKDTVPVLEAAGVGPCQGVPYDGTCEGDVAKRCVSDREGPKKVTKIDCTSVNQVCAVKDGRAQCMDLADVPPPPAPDAGAPEEQTDAGTEPTPEDAGAAAPSEDAGP